MSTTKARHPVHHATLIWLGVEAMASDAAAARLEGIANPAVNTEAQSSEVKRLRNRAEMARYAIAAIERAHP